MENSEAEKESVVIGRAVGIDRRADAVHDRKCDDYVMIKHEAYTLDDELWNADVGDKYQISIGGVIADVEIVKIEKKKWLGGCMLSVCYEGTCAPGQVATPVA